MSEPPTDHQHFTPQTSSANMLNRQRHSRSIQKVKRRWKSPWRSKQSVYMCTEDKTEKSYIYWNTHEHLDRASGCTTTSALHHMLLFLIGIRILTQNQHQHPTVICCAILILHKRNVRVECEEFQKGCWSVHPSPKPHFKISISISPFKSFILIPGEVGAS